MMPQQSQDVHRTTTIKDSGSIEQIELCYITKDDIGDAKENRTKISSLEDLRAVLSVLEQKSQNHGSTQPILSTDSEEATIGQHQFNKQRRHMPQSNNYFNEERLPTDAIIDEVKRFELFRTVIQHEDDLLNQRVSWIILAQSFLMAAFITNTTNDGRGNSLKYITAAVGLLTVVVTLPAILAAGRNIELQQHVYFAKISTEQRCKELHGHGRCIVKGIGESTNNDDANEHEERVRFGHILPNMAFRGRGAMSILNTVIALAAVQVVGWCFLLIALVSGW
jgi:hypothetical protein